MSSVRLRGQPSEAKQWGTRRGRRAAALGRRLQGWARDRPGATRTGEGWWGREGVWPRVSPALRRRNGRVAPITAARLTGRASGRAGRQNVGNSPAHPTSPFSPQSARGEPRHVGCSAPSTTSARSHALFRGFSYKNWADRASEGRLASKPWWGDKMRVFSRMCARFPGWFPRRFFARTRFLEVCATTFSANSVGICPHIAGQLIFSRGTKRDQNNHAPRPARSGRS